MGAIALLDGLGATRRRGQRAQRREDRWPARRARRRRPGRTSARRATRGRRRRRRRSARTAARARAPRRARRATRQPRACARSASSASSEVFPIPGSPVTTANRDEPAHAASSRPPSTSISVSRPTSRCAVAVMSRAPRRLPAPSIRRLRVRDAGVRGAFRVRVQGGAPMSPECRRSRKLAAWLITSSITAARPMTRRPCSLRPRPPRRRRATTPSRSRPRRRPARDAARELAVRESDGIQVRLTWYPGDRAVWVSVSDARTGDRFDLAIPPERALHAFHHPFVYAA